jgi:hypothetical protein
MLFENDGSTVTKEKFYSTLDCLVSIEPELQRIETERTVAIKDAYERLTALVYTIQSFC